MRHNNGDRLATRLDIEALRLATKSDIEGLRAELKANLADTKTEIFKVMLGQTLVIIGAIAALLKLIGH